ncbi:MAG TPA: hypothetical protein VD966_10235, partial [Pyrinomonadaceae bacterium]|nr:hypothetical protein [Pyrinomonadaceae bacterium]
MSSGETSFCRECRAKVAPGDPYCGHCGAAQQTDPAAVKDPAANQDFGSTLGPSLSASPAEAAVADESPEQAQNDAQSNQTVVKQANTGEVEREEDGAPQSTTRAGSTGGRKATAKQLEAGTVLNGRYEIVRRVGGGGMGAVYLAKDRNLGDAPRA